MAASKNQTDLRRARQHTRSVIRNIRDAILQYLEEHGIPLSGVSGSTARREAQQLNRAITAMASRELRQDLIPWLESRRSTTMARAARATFNQMQRSLNADADQLFSSPNLEHKDRALNQELKNIDAALLYENGDSLAEEIGNRATRQIRIGFSQNETVPEISDRVEQVLVDADADTREENGISGMTAKSKAELIAHDSVQDGYVTAAHRRYLNNGFRYARYDAVIDGKTSKVCTRLNEVIVDLVEQPWLLPPNHPWCRSDLRPLLQLPEGAEPISQSEIGDGHLNRIWGTNGFRPKVIDSDAEFNPTALNELLNRTGV